MTNIIKIKRSEIADTIPTISDLAVGELCMNVKGGIGKVSHEGVGTVVEGR